MVQKLNSYREMSQQADARLWDRMGVKKHLEKGAHSTL